MAVNSNGSNNRVAGRDFHEKNIQIERYDGSHTVNIAIPSNNDDDDRPLLKAQRKELNSLVAAIAEASNTEAFIIWQKVHAEIGVAGIDDMTVNQYKTAESFLHAMLERCLLYTSRSVSVSCLCSVNLAGSMAGRGSFQLHANSLMAGIPSRAATPARRGQKGG